MIKIGIHCRRRPFYYLFNDFLFLFLLHSLSFAIFAVNYTLSQNRIFLTILLLLTSVTQKWTTSANLPKISYLTYFDIYFMFGVTLHSAQTAWHAVVSVFVSDKMALLYDKWFLIGFAIYFFLFHIVFILSIARIFPELSKYSKKEKKFLDELKV